MAFFTATADITLQGKNALYISLASGCGRQKQKKPKGRPREEEGSVE
jgi:hypothetical protein